MNNSDCIFCRIATGALPATKVYETDEVIAFLDIGPIIKGHTLVIPKQHYENIISTPIQVMHRLMDVAQIIARAQMKGLRADGVNVIQNNGRASGQLVPHLHVHVIPRYTSDGHHWNWAAKKYEDAAEMEKTAAEIVAGLQNT